jgi:hypothetical protein
MMVCFYLFIHSFIYIHSSIQLFDQSICTHDGKCLGVAAAEDSLHILQYTHFIHLFDRSKKVFGEPYLSVVAMEVSVLVRSTAVTAEEEAGIEAMVEETGSSDVDGGRGDRWSRERSGHREFWDKK